MNARDKAIVADLERFRCLSRDDIAELHFGHVKHPITQTNIVLKRLRRDGLIKCSAEHRKYIYFPAGRSIKPDSQKINHFLAIADFYKQLRRMEPPRVFEVEPKLGEKGLPEPDAFVIWKGAPWFVEIQRTQYSEKMMTEKINRYEKYFVSGEWEREPWQPKDKKIFPYIWIIGIVKYSIGNRPFRVFQFDIKEMLQRIK